MAAYERARRLDPAVITSVAQTFLLMGEWERAIAADRSDPPFTRALGARPARSCAPRASTLLRAAVATPGLHPQLHTLLSGMIAAIEGKP